MQIFVRKKIQKKKVFNKNKKLKIKINVLNCLIIFVTSRSRLYYRDIKDENDNLNNDNDVKINYDLFDSNSYNNFYYCYADENDRFQKGNLEILRIQMGISKLYKLFYLVRSIFDFHQVIKKLSMKIYKMYHYMEYDLKYGFYPDDINGKPYFWLTFNENCLYTKKEIEVKKKKIIEFH